MRVVEIFFLSTMHDGFLRYKKGFTFNLIVVSLPEDYFVHTVMCKVCLLTALASCSAPRNFTVCYLHNMYILKGLRIRLLTASNTVFGADAVVLVKSLNFL